MSIELEVEVEARISVADYVTVASTLGVTSTAEIDGDDGAVIQLHGWATVGFEVQIDAEPKQIRRVRATNVTAFRESVSD